MTNPVLQAAARAVQSQGYQQHVLRRMSYVRKNACKVPPAAVADVLTELRAAYAMHGMALRLCQDALASASPANDPTIHPLIA